MICALPAAKRSLRRVQHDLYYIENWLILFDLYIVLRMLAHLWE